MAASRWAPPAGSGRGFATGRRLGKIFAPEFLEELGRAAHCGDRNDWMMVRAAAMNTGSVPQCPPT